jgi:hypothetical protein
VADRYTEMRQQALAALDHADGWGDLTWGELEDRAETLAQYVLDLLDESLPEGMAELAAECVALRGEVERWKAAWVGRNADANAYLDRATVAEAAIRRANELAGSARPPTLAITEKDLLDPSKPERRG